MSLRIIGALAAKDARLYFRNRFFALVTAMGLVFYVAVFWVMPSVVEETLVIGLTGPDATVSALAGQGGDGLRFAATSSPEALRTGVEEGAYLAGVVLPAGAGPVAVIFAASTPEESRQAVQTLITTLLTALSGTPPAVVLAAEVLGPDLAGRQVPPRDRLRPMLALLIVMVETMGLATLISQEREAGTLRALLVTPVRRRELFTAKALAGTVLALGQAALFMALVGGLAAQPLPVLAALALGAVMVTGLAFVLATLGRDMLSVMAWSVVVLVVLTIPAYGVLFPGSVSGWVQLVPSYYLVRAVDLASNFGLGFSALWDELVILAAVDVAALGLGMAALQRRAL